MTHLHGCDVDEDVWDRVVALWRCSTNKPATAFATAVDRVRRALCDGTLTLQLVLDGPRLLTVTAVLTGR